jgi:hypothetical protein
MEEGTDTQRPDVAHRKEIPVRGGECSAVGGPGSLGFDLAVTQHDMPVTLGVGSSTFVN